MKRIFPAFLLGSALIGCVAVAAAAVGAVAALGAYSYVNNELEREYQAGFDQAWDATLKTVKDMGLTVTSQDKDFQKAHVQARRADDSAVSIQLEERAKDRVMIKVRVGTFESDENRRAAEAIHERIFRAMGGKPEEPKT